MLEERLKRIESTIARQLELNAELRMAALALLQTVQIHQRNFEVIVSPIRPEEQDSDRDDQP